jgi:hypothetical protein
MPGFSLGVFTHRRRKCRPIVAQGLVVGGGDGVGCQMVENAAFRAGPFRSRDMDLLRGACTCSCGQAGM